MDAQNTLLVAALTKSGAINSKELVLVADRPQAVATMWARHGIRTPIVGPPIWSRRPQERHDVVYLLHFALLSLSFSLRGGPSRHCRRRSDVLVRSRHHTTAYQIPPAALP
jgi:hypothetical protein